MSNIPYNVFNGSNEHQNTIDQVASMINNSGYNRGQRRRLEKALGKTNKLSQKVQNKIGQSLYKEYQENLDSNMRRFFSVLGIVLKEKYNLEESEDKEEISEVFDLLNQYLEKYKNLSTDEVAQICFDCTGLELVADKE